MSRAARVVIAAAAMAVAMAEGPPSVRIGGQAPPPPILLVLNNTTDAPFGNYLAEILRAEGLNAFATAQLPTVTGATLANHRLVILAETALSATQAAVFSSYVASGGRLIAMRPDADLFATLGITSQVGSSSNRPATGFLSATINQAGPGAGLQAMSLPFRGAASHYALAGGTSTVATIGGGSATGYPAVIRTGGTAAWSFDLARSVAYVRQGDPLDVNLDRDGQPGYRTMDVFYQRIDLQRVNVPHADVHMRLFVRVIESLLADSLPLPRLWYFPGTNRTIVLPTADSHVSTLSAFTALVNSAQANGARLSLYLARYLSVPSSTVNGWRTAGHEVGLHPYFAADGTSMTGGYTTAANWWQANYPTFAYSPTVRHHDLEWTGWVDPVSVMSSFGMRMDTSYYVWGPSLYNPTSQSQAHGYLNGSGQPMRFVTTAGQVLPVYQQVSALVDQQLVYGAGSESLSVPQAVAVSRQLIDESQAGAYAAIVTQFHVDYYPYAEVGPWADGTMAYAASLQIPMWTMQRWLQFVEARAATTVTNVAWSALNKTLTFTATLPAGAEPHTLLVPATFGSDTVTAVAVGGTSVTAPSLVVNGRTMRAITLTAGAPRDVAVLYAVPTPAIAIGDITVLEGHTGTTTGNLPVTLSSPSSNTVTVNYQTVNGTATQPGDYQSRSGTITFAPFATSQVVAVPIVGDLALESNETFSVTLSTPTNATIEDGTGIVTIGDDDAPPTITITDASVTEGNTGSVPATFTVSLAYASGSPVTVQYATANGTATGGSDFTAGSGTLTFAPGVTTQTVTVAVLGETAAEPNETFTVNLTAPVNGVFGDNQGAGTIVNDDTGTVVTTTTFPVLSGGDDVNEEGTTFAADASTVWLGSGATASTSYAGFRFTGVTIPPGAVISSARLEVRSSTAQWLTNAFEFGIESATSSAPFSAASRPSQRTLLAPRVQHSSNVQWLANTWYQLDELATLLQPLVNQAGWVPGNAVSLVARGAGQNWARKFATAFEGGAAFAPRLVVTYSYVQASPPGLSIGDVTVAEGNSGAANATFAVTLSAPTTQVVTVAWATANGTATAGSDYTASAGTVTFPANSTTQTVTVPILGDTAVEPNETFIVQLTGPTNATIADGQATGTVTNDDSASSSLSIGAATIAEGNGAGTQLSFPVTLTPASGQQVTVTYATADGTAQAGSDYTTTNGSLIFTAGETTKAILVPVTGDTTPEANETLTVTLTAPVNATIGTASAQGTITNDDTPTLTLGNATVVEGSGGTTTAAFTVTLSPASTLTVQVNFATANGTATAGTDYTAASGSVSFAAGETSKQIQVTIAPDTLDEPDEIFTVALSGASNATIAAGGGAGTITDDDGPPALSVTGGAVPEGNTGTTPLAFTVTLAPASGQTVTVAYATSPGTATSPADFTAASGTLSFAPGETSKTVNVPVLGDVTSEANESFTVGLSTPTNASIGTASATGTITNDDAAPVLSINDVTVSEGNAATTPAAFTVSLSVASGQVVTVNWVAVAGTALEGADFAAASGTLTFNPGVTTQPLTVNVVGDTVAEPTETFTVALSIPANATLGDASGLGTITNDDAGPSSVSIGAATVAEGDAGGTQLSFPVTVTPASGQQITVSYATADGTAQAGSDYTTATGQLVFEAGETVKAVPVPVSGDTTPEANETLTVTLSAPVNATLGTASAVGTITNDDTPTLTLGNATVVEGSGGTTTATFTVTLSPASTLPVQVNFATANGTATAGADYTSTTGQLSFLAGETSKQIDVLVAPDVLDEPDETFTVALSGASNATIAAGGGAGTITDDDGPPALSVTAGAVPEGNAGTTPLAFTVTLTPASGQAVTVAYATAPGTAAAPSDFTAASGTLSFAPGETSKVVNVAVLGDALSEANETFTVELSGPTNASIGTGSATGTITNDDAAPVLSIDDVTVNEGNAATTPAAFTVSLSAASGQAVTVVYTATSGTAQAASDFVAEAGTLTFAPGVTSQVATIDLIGDPNPEADETFTVVLSAPANATLGDFTGQGTIVNDDGVPSLAIGDVTVAEGAGSATFTVTLSEAGGQLVTVNYATSGGSAASGSDFTPASGTLTFPIGTLTQTVTVPVAADALSEAAESFTVMLSAPVNATIGDGTATGSITDDDPLPVLAIGDASGSEGNAGTTNLVFTVTLTPASGQSVTVNYQTVNGAAAAPADFTAASGSLTFAPGETTKTVPVAVLGETAVEPDETFSVSLSAPGNATIGGAAGTGTIVNDDLPSLSIGPVSGAEGDAGTTSAVFTVTLSAPSSQTVTVNYAAAGVTATAGTDFTLTPGTATFAPGVTTQTIAVAIAGDTVFEASETYTVTLSAPAGAIVGTPSATGTITNDDTAPSLSISSPSVAEGGAGTVATFTVSLSAASGLPASASYATAAGTATSGSDFTAASGTVTVPAGSTGVSITVPVVGDTLFEADETFSMTLSAPGNATLGVATGVATLTNDDAPPAISVSDAGVVEGNAGSLNAVFTVSLSAVSGLGASASFVTANATATAGSDYTAVSTLVTIPAGSTSVTVNVPVLGDTLVEASETFTVALTVQAGATAGDLAGVGTITDNDLPALSVSDVAIAEGNSGSVALTFTVSLSQAAAVPVTVTYATANGTATAGSDYTAVAATTLTFPPGTASLPVSVNVIGDTAVEPTETFVVNLSGPAGATIADSQGVGTITNDDVAPVPVTVTLQVAAGGDDVNETNGVLTAGAADGWLGNGPSKNASFAGLRFVNVPIPANAIITSARLETQATSTVRERMAFQIGIEAVANSAVFSAASLPSQRLLLAPKVNHSSNTQWQANTWYLINDIAAVLQAAVGQPGWQSGNAVSLVLRGTGQADNRKFVRNFETGAAVAPRLVVTYQVP